MLIVNFFMNASVAEAKQALDTAKAIVASREAAGLQQASLPAAPKPRRRRERKPKQEALPGATATTTPAAGTTGPVAVPDAPKPRRRRGGRPAVADTAASATPLPPVPSGIDLASLPPPSE
jgi:hypothetical protein